MKEKLVDVPVPPFIFGLEALLRRLDDYHPKRQTIENDLGKLQAGYKGELQAGYFLNLLPPDSYCVLHALRLPTETGSYFQMDFLLITAKYYIILEVKNLKGVLIFEPQFNQLIRKTDSQTDYFPCPITQVNLQTSQFSKWLKKNDFPLLPVYPLVVISHSSTMIESKSESHSVKRMVIHSQGLFEKLEAIEAGHKRISGSADIFQLGNTFSERHVEREDMVLRKYRLTNSDIAKGIQCPGCKSFSVRIESRSWVCSNCGHSDRQGYKRAVDDYRKIYGRKVTNTEMKAFLNVESRHIVRRILMKEGRIVGRLGNEHIYYLD